MEKSRIGKNILRVLILMIFLFATISLFDFLISYYDFKKYEKYGKPLVEKGLKQWQKGETEIALITLNEAIELTKFRNNFICSEAFYLKGKILFENKSFAEMDSIISNLKSAILCAEHDKHKTNDIIYIESKLLLGKSYELERNLGMSKKCYEEALSKSQEINDKESIFKSLIQLAKIFKVKNLPSYEFLNTYNTHFNLIWESNDVTANHLKLIIEIIPLIKHYPLADELKRLKGLVNSQRGFLSNIDKTLLPRIYSEIASWHKHNAAIFNGAKGMDGLYTSSIDSSTLYFDKALETAKKLESQNVISEIYQKYGNLLKMKGDVSEAVQMLKKSLKNSVEGFYNIEAYTSLAEILISDKEYEKALNILESFDSSIEIKNLQLYETSVLLNQNKKFYHIYSKLMLEIGDTINAYEFLNKMVILDDILEESKEYLQKMATINSSEELLKFEAEQKRIKGEYKSIRIGTWVLLTILFITYFYFKSDYWNFQKHEYITLRNGKQISARDVIYIEKSKGIDKVIYSTKTHGEIEEYNTLKNLAEGNSKKGVSKLPKEVFTLVHQSYIVNKFEVIDKTAKRITMSNQVEIVISRKNKEDIFEALDKNSNAERNVFDFLQISFTKIYQFLTAKFR